MPRRDDLPVGPLREAVAAYLARDQLATIETLEREAGVPRYTIAHVLRPERRRIDAILADRIAIAIGRHPFELWPNDWIPARYVSAPAGAVPADVLRAVTLAELDRSGRSASEVARAAGVASQTFDSFLKRTRSITIEIAHRIADVIGAELVELYPDEPALRRRRAS